MKNAGLSLEDGHLHVFRTRWGQQVHFTITCFYGDSTLIRGETGWNVSRTLGKGLSVGHRQWRREMKAFHKYISVCVYIYIYICIYVHSKQGTGELDRGWQDQIPPFAWKCDHHIGCNQSPETSAWNGVWLGITVPVTIWLCINFAVCL